MDVVAGVASKIGGVGVFEKVGRQLEICLRLRVLTCRRKQYIIFVKR